MTLIQHLTSGARKYIDSGADIPHDTLKKYLEKDIVTMKDGKIVMFDGRDRRDYDKAKQKELDKLLKEKEKSVARFDKIQNKRGSKLERDLARQRRANARWQRKLARKKK